MGTNIRNEVSKNNEYWIPKYRQLELKYFCLQYKDWLKERNDISLIMRSRTDIERVDTSDVTDSTAELAIKLVNINKKIDIVNEALKKVKYQYFWFYNSNIDLQMDYWIKLGVTEGLGYSSLTARGIPYPKNEYYKAYRMFFYILDSLKDNSQ